VIVCGSWSPTHRTVVPGSIVTEDGLKSRLDIWISRTSSSGPVPSSSSSPHAKPAARTNANTPTSLSTRLSMTRSCPGSPVPTAADLDGPWPHAAASRAPGSPQSRETVTGELTIPEHTVPAPAPPRHGSRGGGAGLTGLSCVQRFPGMLPLLERLRGGEPDSNLGASPRGPGGRDPQASGKMAGGPPRRTPGAAPGRPPPAGSLAGAGYAPGPAKDGGGVTVPRVSAVAPSTG